MGETGRCARAAKENGGEREDDVNRVGGNLPPGGRPAAPPHQLVRELPARTEVERTAKIERLRLLEAMRRDVRDMAVICERYYDPDFHKNERYSI